MRSLPVPLPGREYEIVVGADLLDGVGQGLERLGVGTRAVMITHPDLAARYGEAVVRSVAATGRAIEVVTVPSGEASKSLRELERLYLEFARMRLDRRSVAVALGGGVIGDLTGFAAATYLRGIDFIQIPTTLLAQVDASVGGKTAIDLPVGKNLVGAFHQPRWVVVDVATLASLPSRELRAGLAEVIKYGVIADADLFATLERDRERIVAGDPESLEAIIYRSCEIKAEVVLQDERESGPRMILNYGHTIGHAVEAAAGYADLLHGECVAIGMVAAAGLAVALGMLPVEAAERQKRVIAAYGLPVTIPRVMPTEAILSALRLDKKAEAGTARFVLATAIGRVEYACPVPEERVVALVEGMRAA